MDLIAFPINTIKEKEGEKGGGKFDNNSFQQV